MKLFFRKAILFFVLLIILGNILIAILVYVIPERVLGNMVEYSMWEYQAKASKRKYDERLNVIIGDSRGMAALDPEVLGENYYNLCIGGGTAFEGYHVLKEIASKNTVDTVILCYGSFHYEYSDVFMNRTVPFRFVDRLALDGLSRIESNNASLIDEIGKADYIGFKQTLRLFKYYRMPLFFRASLLDGLISNKGNVRDERLSYMNAHRGHCLFGTRKSCDDVSQEVLNNNLFSPNPVIAAYIDSIMKLADNEKISVFIVLPPFNERTYNAIVNLSYYKDYQNFVSGMLKVYPQLKRIEIYPYMNKNAFGDPSHLNAFGSNVFSKDVCKYLTVR